MAPRVDLATARPRYISAKQAVVLLDDMVTPRDLQRWARQGRIPGAVKVGPKTIRFDRRAILNLVRDLSAEKALDSVYGIIPAPPPAVPAREPSSGRSADHYAVVRWDARTDELRPERAAALR